MEDKIMISYGLNFLIMERLREKMTSLREEYAREYPKDTETLADIPKDCTTVTVWVSLYCGVPDFEDITANDSMVREVALSALSAQTDLPYDFFYYLWLRDEKKAFETLYSDNSIGKFREIDD